MARGTFLVRSVHGGDITAVDAHSDRSFARHAHDEFGVGLMTGGAQYSWSGRGAVEAARGQLITVNPGEVHDGKPIGQARAWSMLYIPARLVGDIVADATEGQIAVRELHQPVVTNRALADLFVQARAAVLNADPARDLGEDLIALFAGLIGTRPLAIGRTDRRISRLREAIDDDPAAAHGLPAMAAQAGFSRFQTLRAFARLTGLTPNAYMVQKRLDLARRRIRRAMPLAETAIEAGFADQSHMHRAFVARYGYTPGQYARAHRVHVANLCKNDPITAH
ncbi:helix-turn-helix domain-containing protein [Sphingopyxis sp.]|uniref:AraC family transcriptional regulator n=1 Tax=Sphingopyxis sp. TaxID=1908224 RepID=UPI003F7184D2